jgi:hypothetical protein
MYLLVHLLSKICSVFTKSTVRHSVPYHDEQYQPETDVGTSKIGLKRVKSYRIILLPISDSCSVKCPCPLLCPYLLCICVGVVPMFVSKSTSMSMSIFMFNQCEREHGREHDMNIATFRRVNCAVTLRMLSTVK